MNNKYIKSTIILLVILFAINIVIATPAPKGLPSCCPSQVNEGAIIEYHTNKAFELYPDSKTCLDSNRIKIECEIKRIEHIKTNTEKDRLQAEEGIQKCRELLESELKTYKETASDRCDNSDKEHHRNNYFSPTHRPSNTTRDQLIDYSTSKRLYDFQDNPPVWEYEKYTGGLNGVDRFETKNLEEYYWETGECRWEDSATEYDNELNELTEPLYQQYCNNVKQDNIDSYESCWNSDKQRNCENICDNEHKDDWKLIAGEWDKSYNDIYDRDTYDEKSVDHMDCRESCTDYKNDFTDCMHNSFEEEYCWVESYLSARTSTLNICSAYYKTTQQASSEFANNFYKIASENNFYAYSIGETSIDIEYKCSEGMIYNSGTGNCVSNEIGKSDISFTLDKKIYKQGQDEYISGTINHICQGDCPGISAYLTIKAKDTSTSFDIEYEGDTFLRKDNPSTKFKIKLNHYNSRYDGIEDQQILVYTDRKSPQEFTFIPQKVNDIQIIPSKIKFRNDEIIKLKVIVDGPKEGKYNYVLTSALDAGFFVDGEYRPIAVMISANKNEIEVEYKPPLISRIIRAQDFYVAELGQLSMEVLPTALRGLSGGLLAHNLGTKITGTTLKGMKVTYDGVGKTVTAADSLLTLGMDGFISAGYSALSLLGNAASSAVAVGDISYKTYQAYARADERLKVFATEAEHDYPVPIKVDVKLEGHEPMKKAIKVTVTAPEAIIK